MEFRHVVGGQYRGRREILDCRAGAGRRGYGPVPRCRFGQQGPGQLAEQPERLAGKLDGGRNLSQLALVGVCCAGRCADRDADQYTDATTADRYRDADRTTFDEYTDGAAADRYRDTAAGADLDKHANSVASDEYTDGTATDRYRDTAAGADLDKHADDIATNRYRDADDAAADEYTVAYANLNEHTNGAATDQYAVTDADIYCADADAVEWKRYAENL